MLMSKTQDVFREAKSKPEILTRQLSSFHISKPLSAITLHDSLQAYCVRPNCEKKTSIDEMFIKNGDDSREIHMGFGKEKRRGEKDA